MLWLFFGFITVALHYKFPSLTTITHTSDEATAVQTSLIAQSPPGDHDRRVISKGQENHAVSFATTDPLRRPHKTPTDTFQRPCEFEGHNVIRLGSWAFSDLWLSDSATMPRCHTDLCLSVYILTFLLGFPSNILAFYTFCKKVRQKARPIDIFLLNLTISDLLFLLFLPFKMHEVANDMIWDMPYFLCPLSGYIFYLTIYTSTFFLMAISVERYLGVAFPIQHSLKRRPVYATAASIFFWIFTCIHLSIVFIMPLIADTPMSTPTNFSNNSDIQNTTTLAETEKVCYENFNQAQLEVLLPVRLELCIVLFFIPFFISSYCYVNFIRILSSLQHINRRKRLRAIGMALGTLVVFVLCFAPYNVSHIVGFIQWKSPNWRDTALLCSTFNACLDPFIFYFSSSAMRGSVSSVLQGVRRKLPSCLSCRVPQVLKISSSNSNSDKDKERKQESVSAI
ncbi:free fatty acid receptor 2-like [Eucyclogobius newberryi]|uniref:free fatty acid receptor 2-like n=1 Tax=Eucyclogobius newberryi TaxID=166745 RepID=UPI003B5AC91F